MKAFEKVAPVYQALGTTVQYEQGVRAIEKLDTNNILNLLADLPRFSGVNKERNYKALQSMMNAIPEEQRVGRIVGIIKIGG